MIENVLYVLLEAIIAALVISWVPYTEIDWPTYMQHIRLFLRGVRNYTELTGPTGPAVYPAGYIYCFTVLYGLTRGGRDVVAAQWIYYVLFVVQCVLVGVVFRQCQVPAHLCKDHY
jgi:alpha-1,3-mannosyltransferase